MYLGLRREAAEIGRRAVTLFAALHEGEGERDKEVCMRESMRERERGISK